MHAKTECSAVVLLRAKWIFSREAFKIGVLCCSAPRRTPLKGVYFRDMCAKSKCSAVVYLRAKWTFPGRSFEKKTFLIKLTLQLFSVLQNLKVHYSTTIRFCMHIVKIFAIKKDFSLHYSTTLWFGMGLPKMFIWLEGTLQHYTVLLHTYPPKNAFRRSSSLYTTALHSNFECLSQKCSFNPKVHYTPFLHAYRQNVCL